MRFTKSSLALLGLSFASTCAAQNQTQDESESSDAWWRSPFGMFQTNLRDIDVDMDTDEVATYIENHGATAWLQSIGGIIANYPTKLDFHYVNPLLESRPGGDLVKDTIDSAHAHGIRVLGRMDFSKVHREVADANAEWAYVSPNGTWQTHPRGLVSVCPSTEWYQNRTFDILDEIIDNYDVEGFFVNYAGYNENDYFRTYWGVCQCESCQRRWSDYSGGKDLPKWREDEDYPEWKLFSDGILNDWTGRVREHIVGRVPDAALILGGAANVMFYEANTAYGRDMWPHATSETVSKFFSWRPEVPVLVNCASFLDHAYRLPAIASQQYIMFHLQALSRAANPSSYILGYPGQIPWPALEEAGELLRFHEEWKDVYTGMRQIAKMGLVLPRLQNLDNNQEQFDASMNEYKGLYSAMLELHIPFEVIALEYLDQIIESGGLDRWEAIILPNTGELRDGYVEGFDAYVENGGTLIATGQVGASDNGTLQLQSLPASRREEYLDELEEFWSTYMAPEQEDPNHAENSNYTAPLIPILESYSLYEWKEDSRGLYEKLTNGTFAPPEYIYGNAQNTSERGVGIGPYEDGTGVLVPFPVGMSYRENGMGVHRDFFEMILKEVTEEPLLRFDGLSEQVEVTLGRNAANQTVVHLLNMSGVKYQGFGQYLPIPASNMTINGDSEGVTAMALRSNTTLEMEDGVIMLPGIDLFDVIVIEGLE